MDLKKFFQKNYIHFIAIGLFLIVGFAYFSKQFGDYALKQHDIEAYKGVSAESMYHQEVDGARPDWNNSLFGGMPNTMISPNNNGNFFKSVITVWNSIFPSPMGIFLLHLISFYIFAMFLRIKPVIGIVGAFAFAFASYEIVILQAGHNTKAIAVALLPAVLGAFIYAFRTNWKIGGVFSALFLGLQISANHLQVTYYFAFVLLALGLYFFIDAVVQKEYKRFGLATGGVLIGYLVALMVNYSYLTEANTYAQYTIRGESDVKTPPKGNDKATEGLDLDYITNWSLDRGETFTFVSPYVRGSHSAPFQGSRFEDLVDDVDLSGEEKRIGPQLSMYWGDQPGTSGPFYMGVVVLFLAFLALLFVNRPIVYILFFVSVLMVFLSWGKNLMGLTEFFVENVPLYNKFRTVTIILVIVELCMPVLAVLFLQHLYENRETIKEKRNLFFIGSGAFLVFLIGLKFTGGDFSGPSDENVLLRQEFSLRNDIMSRPPAELAQMGIDINNEEQIDQLIEQNLEPVRAGIDGAKKLRREMHSKSTTRSLVFGILTMGLLSLLFLTSIPPIGVMVGVGLLVLIDLVPVNLNYLGSDEGYDGEEYLHWMDKDKKSYPIAATPADEEIIKAEIDGNDKLAAMVANAAKRGEKIAEEEELESEYESRVVDFYRFRALAAATNYRVVDLSGRWNGAWNNSSNAYLHKSLGGYHGAKLSRIQNLYDFHLSNGNSSVLDMMNLKYEIRGNQLIPRPSALGNAWAVEKVKTYETADEEIRALGKKYSAKNLSTGSFLINGEVANNATLHGNEDFGYVVSMGDTINMSQSGSMITTMGGLATDMTAVLIRTPQGGTALVNKTDLDRDTVTAFTRLLEITCTDVFNVRKEAVMLAEEAKKLSKKEFSGDAEIEMTSFSPERIEYEVNAKGKQLILFSEVYYPAGWSATINGKETEIIRANYLLRALEVDGGKSKIVFQFENPAKGGPATVSWVGSIVFILLSGFFLVLNLNRIAVQGKHESNS